MAPPPAMGRPTGATVIAVIETILAVLLFLAALALIGLSGIAGGVIGSVDEPGAGGVAAMVAGFGIVAGIIALLIGLLYLAIAYGVWKGRGWAWMLGVVVSIIAIVFGVLGLAGGISLGNIISLALPIIVVYFLWQPDVKRWLGRPT
ncbi:MAG TPA: DUF2127 domain-containing protein [Candidatus Binatia bacterium]|nr:DUF2127 domain-containing protein [Candidatus Binatia bacterium]